MKEAGASTSHTVAPPGTVQTPELNVGNNTPVNGGRLVPNQGYQAGTRLGKLDFPRFDGSGVTEWVSKAMVYEPTSSQTTAQLYHT
ncbi:unnamed protein product [Arabis nemorensis]|uniref:Uncharacterized protein n=1 Tax=Arabis nemorensis TaxID=586526 RepID=A0A565B2A5_9BRAS|nr:unnamed protein product [Arabis nemorensis]